MILSEIGINIAPLLAGAGIVGVAIGFGSQKLVQDLITGIFLLLENAMQVGDTVTVSGLTGVVEALSVRTIRLRAGDGSVHIIPVQLGHQRHQRRTAGWATLRSVSALPLTRTPIALPPNCRRSWPGCARILPCQRKC